MTGRGLAQNANPGRFSSSQERPPDSGFGLRPEAFRDFPQQGVHRHDLKSPLARIEPTVIWVD